MSHKIYKYKLILIFLIIFISNINAQGTWKVFTKKDGLKSNHITQIFEDSKGNLWFNTSGRNVSASTSRGMIKFDGKDWINYYNKHSLILITAFFEDSKGTVWLGARSTEFLLANGLWKINGVSFARISKIGTKLIAESSDGKIWFGGRGRLGIYDGNSVIESSKKTTALYRDNSGNIWVGTKSGVSIYDGKNWKIFSNISNCPTKSVNSIISDAEGNIWFGADNGVFKYDGNNWQHFTVKDGLVADGTLMIKIDSHNNIYAIAINPLLKSNLSVFKNDEWRDFSDGEGVPANLSIRYYEDNSGNLWFNSYDKIIYKFDGVTWTSFNNYKLKNFESVYEDSKGNYWFGSVFGIGKFDGKKWSYFNKDTGLPSNLISSIIEDKEGNMWFATSNKGVVKYTPE